ncbi:MAG: ExeA family protein [Acidiferrobacterales bacterium]
MYLSAFNLKTYPFQVAPDSDFLYLSKAHARAKAYLDYAIWSPDGFVVITGEIGCGKTILIKKVLSELPTSVTVAKIFQTQVDEIEFLQLVLADFGIKAYEAKKVELLDRLNTFLLHQHMQKRQVVLIVDEAQNLSERVLEEIRLLTGLEVQNEKIINVVLAGQSELSDKLNSSGLEQLAQRVQLRFHIKPLSDAETRDYIEHRLAIAGANKRGLFPAETIPLIYRYTGGVPRLVNILCDTVMTAAFVENILLISNHLVKAAIEELQWPPYAERVGKGSQPNPQPVTGQATQPWGDNGSGEGLAHTRELEEKLARLYDFVPKFAGNVTAKMKRIENQLVQLTQSLKDKNKP